MQKAPGNGCFLFIKIRTSKKKSDGFSTVAFVLALPIFPGRLQPSIVGRSELNYRVRNGNGWTLTLINTNFSSGIIPKARAFVKKDLW